MTEARWCTHNPRHINGSFGEAQLTANGNWIQVLAGECFRLTVCPACRTPLWGLPPQEPFDQPSAAHARGYSP